MSCSLPKFPVTFTAGDTLPEIIGSRARQDFTGYTITLQILRPDGVLLQKPATILLDPSKFSFPWNPDGSDLIVGCGQPCNVVSVNPSGQTLTSPQFSIDVVGPLGE